MNTIPSFENDAFERAKQMHRRQPQYNNSNTTNSKPVSSVQNANSPPKQQQIEKEPINNIPEPPPIQKTTATPTIQNNIENSVFNKLFDDKEQTLILLLMILLMEDNSEPPLLLALIYLLM
ncbi:MAG: hypothetical protein MJ089_07130 [Ruminococcus sp.]|nr:hypothetical protein [Ruminococcus sp.]